MKLFVYLFSTGITLGIALYTFNFGAWAWKKGYRRGGIGAWLLAGVTAVLPLYLLFFWPR